MPRKKRRHSSQLPSNAEQSTPLAVGTDVLCIGAGPVGLWTAIQLKLYCPKVRIKLFEKYPTYQRKHLLRLDHSSFIGAHPDDRLQSLLQTLPHNVLTTDIEEKFLKLAKELGIEVVQRNITRPSKLVKEYPDARYIIGSDGAHSVVRQKIFSDNKSKEEDLNYVLDFRYEIGGVAKPLHQYNQALRLLGYTNHLVLEIVGKPTPEGNSPVTLRLFLTKKEYDALKDKATFKHPLSLKDDMPQDVRDTLTVWLKGRKKFLNETPSQSQEKITVVRLGNYVSHGFVKHRGHADYVLVGDAAFGVPYFRSLNNGLICGTQLASALATNFGAKVTLRDFFTKTHHAKWALGYSPLESYDAFVKNYANVETSLAWMKTLGIKSANYFHYRTQQSPTKTLFAYGGHNLFDKGDFDLNLIALKKNLRNIVSRERDYLLEWLGCTQDKKRAAGHLLVEIDRLQKSHPNSPKEIQEGLRRWRKTHPNDSKTLQQERSIYRILLMLIGFKFQTRSHMLVERLCRANCP